MTHHLPPQNALQPGEIVMSEAGHRYRILEVTEHSVSLIRVNGQTVFAYRPAIAASLFSAISAPSTTAQASKSHSPAPQS